MQLIGTAFFLISLIRLVLELIIDQNLLYKWYNTSGFKIKNVVVVC